MSASSYVPTGLRSRFADLVDPRHPLDDYPRPMLERARWINLNGLYEYAITPVESPVPEHFEGSILVPFCIESPLSGVGRMLSEHEKLWYRRRVPKPALACGRRLILHFEAVDHVAEVYIDGRLIGRHVGGYLPFEFDVTDAVGGTEFDLVVGVTDPTDAGFQERGKQVRRPGGIWYTATSGIWQTVWMEVVGAVHLERLDVVPDFDGAAVRVRPVLAGDASATIRTVIRDGDAPLAFAMLPPDRETVIPLPDFRSWTPDAPHLYGIDVVVEIDGIECDAVHSHFGMRKVAVAADRDGRPRIHLNGRPLFQAGVLDQGYWPESLMTAPTDAALIDDILTMKKLGFNMIRKHAKIESRRWYWHCDRIGMLVWQDVPSGGAGNLGPWLGAIRPYAFPRLPIDDRRYGRFGRSDPASREGFLALLDGMVDLLSNHPAIVCWVPFNEGWGQFDSAAVAARVARRDPSRLVDAASGWYDRKAGDFVSIHRYFIRLKAPKTSPGRAFVLSEFGGYSRRIAGHVAAAKTFGYRTYATAAGLADAYAELLEKQVLPLVAKGLAATVYTQLSDVEDEINGLLTYDRAVLKIDEETVRRGNRRLIETPSETTESE